MMASPAIRVLIADDHAIVREGVRSVLSLDEGFDVVGEAVTGAEAVDLAQSLKPDVVVLDLSMPELSGLDAAARIRE
jgi:DNA-binding NarL/FixJ family response regulator